MGGRVPSPTSDLVSVALASAGASVTLTYEREVTGGAAALVRATVAGGALTATSAGAAGSTVTVSFHRATGGRWPPRVRSEPIELELR